MEKYVKIKITTVLLLFCFFEIPSVLNAQEYYRVVETKGVITSGGKEIKIGGLYLKGQKVDWKGRQWMKVTRNGQEYRVDSNGIKKSHTKTEKTQKISNIYLIHRGWDQNNKGDTINYSQQCYYLIGKKDFLYFERKASEKDVLVEAVWNYKGEQMSSPIKCTSDGNSYIITAMIFKDMKDTNNIRISICEKKDGYLYNDYTHGLNIYYYP